MTGQVEPNAMQCSRAVTRNGGCRTESSVRCAEHLLASVNANGGINPGQKLIKPKTTRMIKCECPECGYTLRTTQKWLDIAVPICPDVTCSEYENRLEVEIKEGGSCTNV